MNEHKFPYKSTLKHASLFSGIGGFDLPSEWMGWTNVFNCEIEEFPKKILNYYWPNSVQYDDIKQTDFRIHRGTIDILTGGFPCQPFSHAGKRKGKEDDRFLWYEMRRAIREIKPTWIVAENVLGIINQNRGLVFEEVQADLENEGYKVQTYILPACAVNAPHKRYRTWFIAHNNSYRCTGSSPTKDYDKSNEQRNKKGGQYSAHNQRRKVNESIRPTTNPNSGQRSERRGNKKRPEEAERYFSSFDSWDFGDAWQVFPTQSPVCGRDDGLPSKLDGITFPKWRNESIKGYGNAVVPQLVLQIFKTIQEFYQD